MAISKVILNGETLIDTTDKTVTSSTLVSPQTALAADGTTVTGALVQKSASDITVSGATTTIPAGVYSSQVQKTVSSGTATTPATTITTTPTISVNSSGLITASNSKTQSVTPTVSAGYISSGTAGTITVNGSNTSQLTTQAASTWTPTTTSQTINSGRYLTGNQTIAGDSNLVASNIASGISIFGVTGTFQGGADCPTFTIEIEDSSGDITWAECDKTYNECLAYFNSSSELTNGAIVNFKYYDDNEQLIRELTAGATALANTLTSPADIVYSVPDMAQDGMIAGFLITYNSSGAVIVTEDPVTRRNSSSLTSNNLTVTAPDGYYSSSATKTLTDSNLTAGNIKKDISIFGVTGTYQPNLDSISIKAENCLSSSTQITPETYICETDNTYPGTAISMDNTIVCNIGTYLNNSIKLELNKTYHCIGQLFIKWDNDNTEEYYYIDSDFTPTSYSNPTRLSSFTWEGSTGATQTFLYINLDIPTSQQGHSTRMRPSRSTQLTKSGVLLSGSFYRITQLEIDGYETINLNFNDNPKFLDIYRSLAYRSTISSAAPGVSEWFDSLTNIHAYQFAGQLFSGNFDLNNVSNVSTYGFGDPYGGFNSGFAYYSINFLRSSGTTLQSAAFICNRGIKSINAPYITSLNSNSIFCSCGNLSSVSFPECSIINGTYVFTGCNTLNTIYFPKCTYIAYGTFMSCYKLTSASFPSCTFIGQYAFSNCSSLANIYFPSCSTISSNAFGYCKKLTTIEFPQCSMIHQLAFSNCIGLTSISFPECLSISNEVFTYCSGLTSVNLPKCTYLGISAFGSCTNLTSIYLSACTTILNSAFMSCSNLINLSTPECTNIGSSAFNGCSKLPMISFPKCQQIASSAFYNCKSLSSAYFMGSSIPTIGTNIFMYTPMSNSTYLGYFGSIYVPSSLLASYKTATNWATYSARMVGI